MQHSPLSNLIETLVHTIEIDAAALRERFILRQTLHALVRQAKAEQVAAMRADVRRMAGMDSHGQVRASDPVDSGNPR